MLAVADQLILVAPASADAASALATTLEWLEAHGFAELADSAITVMNGVSRHTLPPSSTPRPWRAAGAAPSSGCPGTIT